MTPPTGLIRDLVERRIPATMKCRMNVIDVRTLAEGLIAARDMGRSGERYLLTGEDLSMEEFLDALSRISGVAMPSRNVPASIAHAAALIDEKLISRLTGKPPRAPLTGVRLARTNINFDNSKARSELNLNVTPIDDALRDALEWLRDEGLVSNPAR